MRSPGRTGCQASPAPWVMALLALATAFPVLGTIWTRATNVIKVPRGTRENLPNTAYATREWSTAITSVEVHDDSPLAGDTCLPRWTFFYKNTDSQPHYVTITVLCQDIHRNERARFSYNATLGPDHKEDFGLDVAAKVKCDAWKQTMLVKITVDFLSTPNG